VCNFLAFIKTALLADTSSETDRSDNDRKFVAFGRENPVLIKLMALTIYTKVVILRPRPRPRPRPQIFALRPRPKPRTNITGCGAYLFP